MTFRYLTNVIIAPFGAWVPVKAIGQNPREMVLKERREFAKHRKEGRVAALPAVVAGRGRAGSEAGPALTTGAAGRPAKRAALSRATGLWARAGP